MARIYISSTYEDLKKEREAAAQAVRRLGHQTVSMEDYVASPQFPMDKCRQDVRRCDIYIGIFAWRYGFIPDGYDKSITHLEYETAQKAGIPCLIFLTDPKASWPGEYVTTGAERQKIDRLRSALVNEYIVSFFKNADELGGLVSPAVSELILMTERSFIKFKRPEELIGTRLGKYVIKDKLGSGGKGVVFKVLDTLEDREKAIKMVPPRVADSPVAFKELKREVNTAACIIHPNVVKVLGLEEYQEQYFIVMEYIEGRSLEQILADSKDGKLKETEVLAIMQKLAGGLLETHKNKVIHRDIKPSNVMVTPGGQVKILDFGVSYQVTKSMTEMVGEHQGMGTWPYMAPEQLSTRYGRENRQVDIWGFGVTMYQLLTGQLPFTNKDQIKDESEKPYEMAGVSRKTRDLVMKCLEKDRKKRFQNMEQVLSAFDKIGRVKIKIKDRYKDKDKEKEKHKGNSRWKWGLAAAALIVLIILAVLLAQLTKQEGEIPMTGKKTVTPLIADTKPGFLTAVEKIAKGVYQNDSGYWEAGYDDEIIMVYIPPGNFTMGSNDGDSDEKKPHNVDLDGYWIGKYEVTLGQYKAFITDTGYRNLPSWVSKYSPGNNHPVVGVSWDDANAYCQWLSKKTGLKFKLPTEAQWEKAARGTDGRKYPWGNHDPYYNGQYYANYDPGKDDADGYIYTAPVGSFPNGVSPYGLLDMAGNVWEWCSDWYDENYYRSSPDKNPAGPQSGSNRVVRGRSWSLDAWGLRCANRNGFGPSDRNGGLGFRLRQDNK
jgi:formylglycine-generating enzyme required for sulfatase activity